MKWARASPQRMEIERSIVVPWVTYHGNLNNWTLWKGVGVAFSSRVWHFSVSRLWVRAKAVSFRSAFTPYPGEKTLVAFVQGSIIQILTGRVTFPVGSILLQWIATCWQTDSSLMLRGTPSCPGRRHRCCRSRILRKRLVLRHRAWSTIAILLSGSTRSLPISHLEWSILRVSGRQIYWLRQ